MTDEPKVFYLMAENKKSFILYADQKELFDQLPDDKAGELIKHIFKYVNDENPITDDVIINLAFTPIKKQFKRDLERWEQTKEGRSKAGKASAAARKAKKEAQQNLTNSTNVNFVKENSTNSTVNDNVNVNDNVILKDDFYNSFTFLEAQAKAKKTTVDCINRLKVVFWEGNYEGQEQPKSLNDLKKHFGNWLKFQELDRIKPTIVKHWNEL